MFNPKPKTVSSTHRANVAIRQTATTTAVWFLSSSLVGQWTFFSSARELLKYFPIDWDFVGAVAVWFATVLHILFSLYPPLFTWFLGAGYAHGQTCSIFSAQCGPDHFSCSWWYCSFFFCIRYTPVLLSLSSFTPPCQALKSPLAVLSKPLSGSTTH